MSLQVFGIDGKGPLEFLDGVGVALLKKADTAKLVADDAVARKLRKHDLQMSCGAIVIAVFLKRTCVEVVGAPQQIGRASCRERVEIWVVEVSAKRRQGKVR